MIKENSLQWLKLINIAEIKFKFKFNKLQCLTQENYF